jgi:hypothetical protein
MIVGNAGGAAGILQTASTTSSVVAQVHQLVNHPFSMLLLFVTIGAIFLITEYLELRKT